jgi:hypothetical protein
VDAHLEDTFADWLTIAEIAELGGSDPMQDPRTRHPVV